MNPKITCKHLKYALILVSAICLLSGCGPKPKNLHEAAGRGDLGAVRQFIDEGGDVNGLGVEAETPLQAAAYEGHWRVVEYLLDHGAIIDKKTDYECDATALQLAAMGDRARVVKLLLSRGAKANTKDYSGRNALHYAADSETGSTIQMLVDKGADINAHDNEGNTPLCDAVLSSKLSAVKEMVRCGADVNEPDKYGVTVLTYAIKNDQKSIATFLVDNGSRLDIYSAAGLDNVSCVEMILKSGVDIDNADGLGYTALHYAAMCGSVKTVSFLIDNGANINATNGGKWTPLICAIVGQSPYRDTNVEERLKIARMLILAGADLNVRDKGGRSAREWASAKGYSELETMIAEHGGKALDLMELLKEK